MNFNRLIVSLLLLAWGQTSLAVGLRAMTFTIAPVVVGVSETLSDEAAAFFDRSADELVRQSGETPLIVRRMSSAALIAAAEKGELDFTLTTAREFAYLERYYGSKALAGTLPPGAVRSDRTTGLVMLAPSEETVRDLASATFVANADHYRELLFQIRLYFSQRGLSADPKVISNGPDTPTDAVFLTETCSPQAEDRESWIVEGKLLPELPCRTTGELLPGPVFARTLHTDDRRAEMIGRFLRGAASEDGWRWSSPANLSHLHGVLSTYDDEYRHGPSGGWEAVVRRYGWMLAVLVGAILLLIANAVWLRFQVRKRTEELEAVQREKAEALEKAAVIEKAGIVNQMSSIVAHEIRQPLTAVRNYLGSVRRRNRKGTLSTDELAGVVENMLGELQRADSIVERVRSYARAKTGNRSDIDVSDVIRREMAFEYASSAECRIEPGIVMSADELEIRLIVSNLIKNARDAARHSPQERPSVLLLWERISGGARLTVSDNGPALDDNAFEHLAEPLRTTKADGLGLGLSIVSTLCESYGAKLEFHRKQPNGLTVVVNFPQAS